MDSRVVGQQQLELHVRLAQRRRGRLEQLAQRIAGAGARCPSGRISSQPVLEAIAGGAAQAAAQRAVRLGGVGE